MLFAHADRRTQPLTGKISAPALYRLECSTPSNSPLISEVQLANPEPSQPVILLASVPLTGEAWRPMLEGEVIAIRNGKIVSSRQIEARSF